MTPVLPGALAGHAMLARTVLLAVSLSVHATLAAVVGLPMRSPADPGRILVVELEVRADVASIPPPAAPTRRAAAASRPTIPPRADALTPPRPLTMPLPTPVEVPTPADPQRRADVEPARALPIPPPSVAGRAAPGMAQDLLEAPADPSGEAGAVAGPTPASVASPPGRASAKWAGAEDHRLPATTQGSGSRSDSAPRAPESEAVDTTAGVAAVAPPGGDGLTRTVIPRGGYQHRPAYPASARRLGVQGTTLLGVLVTAEGRVGDVQVRQSAGHRDLDQAAIEAVRRWRFEPARRGTEAVAMWVTLPVEFRLR